MTIWLTSDEHFHHKNIILYCNRPYSNVEDMNRDIIVRHNAVVKSEDTVYHLGDFAFKNVKGILDQLNGTKHLIAGNHDACYNSHKNYQKEIKKYLDYGFTSVQQEILNFHGFTLNHLPYIEDHSVKIRFVSQRPKDNGGWLLHGHVHQSWKIKDKQINVGVDVNDFYPISLDHLLTLVK